MSPTIVVSAPICRAFATTAVEALKTPLIPAVLHPMLQGDVQA